MTASETLRLKREEWQAVIRTLSPSEAAFFTIILCQVNELLDIKEAAIRDGTTNPGRAEGLAGLLPYAEIDSLTGHAQALAVFDGSLALGVDDVVATVGGDILRIVPNWSIPRHPVDRAIWRESGDALTLVSVVEKADDEAIRRTLDAAVYAVSAGFGTTDTVRPVLAVVGDEDATVAAAVKDAGVKYLPLGNLHYHRMMSSLVQMVTTGWPA